MVSLECLVLEMLILMEWSRGQRSCFERILTSHIQDNLNIKETFLNVVMVSWLQTVPILRRCMLKYLELRLMVSQTNFILAKRKCMYKREMKPF